MYWDVSYGEYAHMWFAELYAESSDNQYTFLTYKKFFTEHEAWAYVNDMSIE